MSKPRKSFLLHFDSLGILDKLTKEQAGELFIACRDYNLGKELDLDPVLELVFFSFKSQFDRDIEKYQIVVDRNKNNGSKGGRPKNPKEPKKPSGLSGNPKEPKKPDSDSDSDSDSDNKKNKNTHQQIADIWNEVFKDELPAVAKVTQKRKSAINGCIAEMKSTGNDFSNPETWRGLFEYCKDSDFLMGRKTDWAMTFDFIVTKSKLLKVIEGDYENARATA